MNLVILGPQGCGKGTQARMLAQKFHLEHVDMGRTLREVAVLDTDFGRHVNEIINVKKELVSDEILKKVLHIKLADIPREQDVVFDGVPRNARQAGYFENAMREFGREIDKVIFINISEEESIRRISKRRVCKNCKAPYVLGEDIQDGEDQCQRCGGEVVIRPDDSEAGVRKRLGIFKKETCPILENYRSTGTLLEVNGEQSPQKVFDEILKKLDH